MTVRIKPKTYGPLQLRSGADGAIRLVTEGGHALAGGTAPGPDGASPSDLILASLASCIAISMRMAARQMALELGALAVSARAIKATDLPNRFGRFEVSVQPESPVPAERTQELLARTHDLCTISNTLGAEVVVQLGDPGGLGADAPAGH